MNPSRERHRSARLLKHLYEQLPHATTGVAHSKRSSLGTWRCCSKQAAA